MQFRNEYQFLSNMSPSPIRLTYGDKTYQYSCVESAFQACKCPERMGEFQNLTGPEAKKLGRQVPLRADWEDIKVNVMRQLVDMKFRQNPNLKQALLNTGLNTEIAEENTWGDRYWGVVNGQGQNMLGKILMGARTQFYQEQQAQQAQTQEPKPAQQAKKPMQVLYEFDDIYNLPQGPNEILCITTNGMTKKDGRAVMGKGIALTADQRFDLSYDLGRMLSQYGNHVFDLGMRVDKQTGRQVHIVTLPTKQHWKDDSDIDLVKQSIQEVVQLCNQKGYTKCYTTAPGCALGHLDWETQVKPIMDAVMDDRFVVADWALQKEHQKQQGIATDNQAMRPGEVPVQQKSQPVTTAQQTQSQPAQTQPAQEQTQQFHGKTLCFTGHRPKDLCPDAPDKYDARPYKKFVNDLTVYLDGMYNAGYRNFISGGAQGFDQLAFWAVEKLKAVHPDIQNIAYLPFKGQESAWVDNDGLFTPKNYRKMLKHADKIVWTSERQGIQVDTTTGRNVGRALDMRNHAMVDDADLVIALYRDPRGVDINKTHGSGTNNCMRYAVEQGVPIYQIVCQNDETGAIKGAPQINVMEPLNARAEKKIPMWLQPEGQPARNMADIDAAYTGIQQDTEELYTSYGVDF